MPEQLSLFDEDVAQRIRRREREVLDDQIRDFESVFGAEEDEGDDSE